jgi:hypothetical protein
MYTTNFSIQFCTTAIDCIYEFVIILRIQTDYFGKQSQPMASPIEKCYVFFEV